MMRLVGDRILVALQPSEHVQDDVTGYSYKPGDKTASGLILASRADAYDPDASTRGIVMQLGEKRGLVDIDDVRAELNEYFLSDERLDDEVEGPFIKDELDRLLMKMAPAPFDVQIGDMVVFARTSGSGFEYDDVHYVILTEDDILGVLEPKKEAAA